MLMKKAPAAASPQAYVDAVEGWQRRVVEALRASVRAASRLEERVKWGHLVYLSNDSPVLLIRAEPQRVLFGFWQGQRLRSIEPRLKPGGKYEMATLELREGDNISSTVTRRLTREAVLLNESPGDPRNAGKPGRRSTS